MTADCALMILWPSTAVAAMMNDDEPFFSPKSKTHLLREPPPGKSPWTRHKQAQGWTVEP